MLENKLFFLITQATDDMNAPIDIKLKGDVIRLVRMMCRAMDEEPGIESCILSAAATYLREHGDKVMNFKITAGI